MWNGNTLLAGPCVNSAIRNSVSAFLVDRVLRADSYTYSGPLPPLVIQIYSAIHFRGGPTDADAMTRCKLAVLPSLQDSLLGIFTAKWAR